MYLKSHHVQNVKLLRDIHIDFTRADGSPRMWTVFVGENRLCKTTLLQTLAAGACGIDRGTQIVADTVASWPDLRKLDRLNITTEFCFSEERNRHRKYPGLRDQPSHPPTLRSTLSLDPGKRVFAGRSEYEELQSEVTDPLTQARSESLPDWFVAAYGVSRQLPAASRAPRQNEPVLDRVRPLFGESLIGTGFMELLGEELGRAFVKVLQAVFVPGGLLPHVTALELRGRGGIRSSRDLVESQRFEMDVLDTEGVYIRVPAAWLSQGYQSLIAWVADFVGHIFIEAGEPVSAVDMEGLVLVDELDVHLHPTWQVQLVPALKRAFPRLQFVATTHSPMLLPALAQEEVFVLSQDSEGSVVATQSAQAPALLTGSELYSGFFGIRKLHPDALGEKVRHYGNLASDPTRSEEDDATLLSLRRELEGAGIQFDWEPVARESRS
jgi:hypothetical protein